MRKIQTLNDLSKLKRINKELQTDITKLLKDFEATVSEKNVFNLINKFRVRAKKILDKCEHYKNVVSELTSDTTAKAHTEEIIKNFSDKITIILQNLENLSNAEVISCAKHISV